MNPEHGPPDDEFDRLIADDDLFDRALAEANSQALLEHSRAGNPVAEWRDGRVVWVSPEQVRRELAERHNSA